MAYTNKFMKTQLVIVPIKTPVTAYFITDSPQALVNPHVKAKKEHELHRFFPQS